MYPAYSLRKFCLELIDLVEVLPRQIDIGASEVTICSGLLVDRAAKIEHLDDSGRAEVEVPADDLDDLLVINLTGSEGADIDRGRLCYTDCIGKLDLKSVCIARCHEVLRDIPRCVSCGTVNLRAVLAGECSAAVTTDTAIGIDDDLAAGETCIAVRSADDETSGRIDEDLGVVINHGRINNRVDNVLADILVDLLLRNLFVMLSRNDDRLKADRLVVLVILNGNLRLAVCAEIRQL